MATRLLMVHHSSSSSSSKSIGPSNIAKTFSGSETESAAFDTTPFHTAQRVLFQPVPNNNVPSGYIFSSFSIKPRTIGYFYGHVNTTSLVGVDKQNLPLPNNRFFHIRRSTLLQNEDMDRQLQLQNSKDYRRGRAETMADMGKNCVAQYDWQESFYPTCNTVMEVDMIESLLRQSKLHASQSRDSVSQDETKEKETDVDSNLSTTPIRMKPSTTLRFLSRGYWRDVWQLNQEPNEILVVKTQRYEHDFHERNYDRHRRDAVAMERLTSSPFIMDIYGFCATSGVFEFADGGSLEDAMFVSSEDDSSVQPWNAMERLVVSYQVAAALAAVHNYPKNGVPAIAHTDIAPGQYVYSQQAQSFKLQDFNRARFLAWNNKTNLLCTYEVGNNPGTLRSPEEYAYEPQTEKVDVYSMGNVFYSILTMTYPFNHERSKDVQEKVKNGERPFIPESIRNSTDPFDRAILEAIDMCWVQDPSERATARQVQKHIVATLKRMKVKG
ncbi:protein kinase domain containing protein [Nitzschia inconspicua]|uniref:Protein kinase domain containing protein n=1 Tax=Nitzschia inconspicua TaxID=303405 RepID=A0A9K3KRQ0_9STRA|nr:protein kinase domain containing protein [Nitzschia inconspicua]